MKVRQCPVSVLVESVMSNYQVINSRGTSNKTTWVPEAAREFLIKNGTAYTYADLLLIAQQQQQLEEEYATQLQQSFTPHPSPLTPLFIDTNQYVMKVWCEVVFGKCHSWILNQAAAASYDLYLLCNVDLPWVQDGLREYPDPEQRRRLFLEYKDIVVNDGTPWVLISGTETARLEKAIEAVDALLK